DELWDRYPGHVSSGRRLHRSNPQGREARRPAGRTVHQIRVFDQPADGQGTWPRRAQLDPIARRPADRIAVPFVASAHGRSWHETAVLCVPANVCSWGGDLNRSTQHLLILLDKEVADGDVTDIVHGEAEG